MFLYSRLFANFIDINQTILLQSKNRSFMKLTSFLLKIDSLFSLIVSETSLRGKFDCRKIRLNVALRPRVNDRLAMIVIIFTVMSRFCICTVW